MAVNSLTETTGYRVRLRTARVFAYLFLALVTFLSLAPILLLVINCTHTDAELNNRFTLLPGTAFFANLKSAWTDSNLFEISRGLLNSFIIAAGSCILTAYFSAMTAYGIHVYDFKLKRFLMTFILMIMTIPTQVSAVGFVELLRNMKLTNNYFGLIIPAIAAPSVFFYMKQYIESSMPLEVIEAARVDGSNEFRTFNTIALPMLKPALSVQLIFAFVASWNNFFTPALVLDKAKMWTVPVMLSVLRADLNSQSGDLGKVYMFTFLSIIPVVIVYFFISRNIVEGVALGAVKG